MLVPPWSKSPFARLLIPLTAGIIFQWYLPQGMIILASLLLVGFTGINIYNFLPLSRQFRFRVLGGLLINLVLLTIGALLVWKNDLREDVVEFEKYFNDQDFITAVLEEPPEEKTNSFKALAKIQVGINGMDKAADVVLYFDKEIRPLNLQYGSVISFRKKPQPVRNSGNPGGFDYKRFMLFEGIGFQCYLKTEDLFLHKEPCKKSFRNFIINSRLWTISTIRKYIPGKKEQGLAEALLIGYKNDLDRDLIKAYSNTGVVHVIAISGLHLGLVYWILLMLTKPLKRKKTGITRLLIIISGLWIFSIIAGAQPSVVRSALMFSCVALGETIQKRSGIYNTLSLSAFMLLCYNPFWLWDAGFQLSYAAVFSIVSFSRPLYNLFYFPNRLIDFFWKINSVTFSAQLMTLPLSIFHFHQFPNLFFMTNVLAVPLASIILVSAILLCTISFSTFPATLLGAFLHKMIFLMNSYIERFDGLSISVSSGLLITLPQTILLTASILCLSYWLIEKKTWLFYAGLSTALVFAVLRSYSFYVSHEQQKIVVYNIPKQTVIENIEGRNSKVMAGPQFLNDPAAYDLHIKPSHILHRTSKWEVAGIPSAFSFGGKHVVVLQNHVEDQAVKADVLLITRSSTMKIEKAIAHYQPRNIVIDGSVSFTKASKIKLILDSMQVRYHHVQEKGAFILPLENLPL
jgi:competence protein ComEC